MNFSGNNLSNFNEICKESLQNLKVLKLIDCQLKACDFVFFSFSKLEELDCSLNNFSKVTQGILRTSESNKLKIIKLSNCGIHSEKFIRSLFDIENLEELNISGNNLNFSFKDIELGKAKDSIKVLELKDCSIFSLETLKSITNFKFLERLDISNNGFGDVCNEFEIGSSKDSLIELDIELNMIDYNGLRVITDCGKLKKLNVSGNNFENMPNGFTLGCSKYSLEELNIERSYLNINGFKAITDCIKLEKLNGSYNCFISEGFVFGRSKFSLKSLVMNSSLCSSSLKIFSDCPKLEKLEARFCRFEDIEKGFSLGISRETLKEIDISFVNSYGLKAITECPKLEKLTIVCRNLLSEDFTLGCLV